jgi:hypothetical protein
MGATVAAKNRKVRQESLREQLAAGGHVQHVIDISKKLSDQYTDLESSQIQALRAAADIKLKLIGKYLPDLKATEITGADGEDIGVAIKVIYD